MTAAPTPGGGGSPHGSATPGERVGTPAGREAPTITPAEIYQIVRGRLAAHVITKDRDGRIQVRPYVNLRSAARAVTRARERGHSATVVMVRQDVAPLVDPAEATGRAPA